jgi:hypothetical protein
MISNTIFSPVNLDALILLPLRYFFSTNTSPSTFYWDPDEKKRTLELDYMNNLHKIPFNERPRVLVDRGSYTIPKMSITDNMAVAKTMDQTFGLTDLENMVIYQGQASVTIEATQKGSCEILTDMVQHFLLWTRPYLCNTQGFKDFGLPMTVSECELDAEDEGKEKFRVVITLPYIKEERWKVRNDSIKIKNFVTTYQLAS